MIAGCAAPNLLTMYPEIIVPLDGSELAEQVLPYTELFAGALSVPVELVQAFDILMTALQGSREYVTIRAHLERIGRERAVQSLMPARQRLESAGCVVGIAVELGQAADVIAAQAGIDPTALVMMSTHGRGGISRWALGSVADKVLHTIHNPLLMVRAADRGGPVSEASLQTVVVPLDGSALSELAIPHAVGVATALSANIVALRVTPTEGHYRHRISMIAPPPGTAQTFHLATPSELLAEDAATAAAYLADVKDRIAADRQIETTVEHIVSDDAAQTIVERASTQSSLVVMTTHGRGGLGRLMMGSVADRVIRHSNAPVLAIR